MRESNISFSTELKQRAIEMVDYAVGAPSGVEIVENILDIGRMLVDKNRAYGDSALSPVRVFSKASTEEQILVRLDDKLSRLARGSASGEDVELDLIGYIVLLRIARARSAR